MATTTPAPVNGEVSALTASIPHAFWAAAAAVAVPGLSSTSWIIRIGIGGAIPTTVGSRDASSTSFIDSSALSIVGRTTVSVSAAMPAVKPAENGSVVGESAMFRRMVNRRMVCLPLTACADCGRARAARAVGAVIAEECPAESTDRPARTSSR
jgi:hypothetical protein